MVWGGCTEQVRQLGRAEPSAQRPQLPEARVPFCLCASLSRGLNRHLFQPPRGTGPQACSAVTSAKCGVREREWRQRGVPARLSHRGWHRRCVSPGEEGRVLVNGQSEG